MCVYLCFDVGHGRVTEFQSVSVEDFVEFMLFWKMLFDYLQEELTNFYFDCLTIRWVKS